VPTFTEITGYRSIRQLDDDAHRGYRDGNEYAEAKNLDKRLAVAPRRSSFHEEEVFEVSTFMDLDQLTNAIFQESFKEEIEYGDGDSLGSVDEEIERVEKHERGSHSRDFGGTEPRR
jgi:hypothetical protein